MGAYMGLTPETQGIAYFDRIIVSLTAFQFGFLGAYVYFIRHLVRSYFTTDLTPNTFVAMSVRMVTAGLVALVLSFALPNLNSSEDESTVRAFLPVVSFGIGFFPDWGLIAVERITRRMLLLGRVVQPTSTPLSSLSGMSYEHEARLNRQGYDSVENIADANLVEMAVRTGFSYAQLRTWAGEAWLRVRLGSEDYRKFANATGVRTADDFKMVFGSRTKEAIVALSADAGIHTMNTKLCCIAEVVREWSPERRAVSSAATLMDA
jgi:hypothetical protein